MDKPRYLSLGTLASGTVKAEDWIDGLRYDLERIRLSKADRKIVREALAEYDKDDGGQDRIDVSELLDELIQVAENYLQPFCRLGTLEGDGAEFGVWADVESVQNDDEVWHAVDGRDAEGMSCTEYARYDYARKELERRATAPRGAYVLVVSDHGNCTLYCNGREVWGVV